MRFRVAALPLSLAALLAGCVQRLPPAPVPPNPYGYLKRSALCDHSPVKREGAGLSSQMKVRSDDGLCEIILSQPQGGAYASFVLSRAPEHGRDLIYNYNDHTYITYTADTAYAGPDRFTAALIIAPGQPRTSLDVAINVDATGVAPPAPPPPPAETKGKTATSGTASHRRRRVVHKTHNDSNSPSNTGVGSSQSH